MRSGTPFPAIRCTWSSLADVIRSKEAAGRERDRASLPTLRMLLERLEQADDAGVGLERLAY
jgi:hypothetical protein